MSDGDDVFDVLCYGTISMESVTRRHTCRRPNVMRRR